MTSLRNLTLYSGLSQGVDLSVKVFMGRQFCWYTLSSLCSCYYLFRMVYVLVDIFIDCSTFSWKVKCNWRGIAPLSLNSSDAGDGIFQLWWSILCLEMQYIQWNSVYFVFYFVVVISSILNGPYSQIPEWTCSISHNAPFRTVLNGALWDMEPVHSGICEIVPLISALTGTR